MSDAPVILYSPGLKALKTRLVVVMAVADDGQWKKFAVHLIRREC